jgi:NADPH-dependent glutamate synthase beta subunit-like oxidoreductase
MGSAFDQRANGPYEPISSKINRICIIGAGPSGLAAAK